MTCWKQNSKHVTDCLNRLNHCSEGQNSWTCGTVLFVIKMLSICYIIFWHVGRLCADLTALSAYLGYIVVWLKSW